MATTLTIFENNSVLITTDINVQDLSGFTGVFYVKKYSSDEDYIMEITGVTSTGSTITFTLSATNTDINPGKYLYEIRITNGSVTYTVNSGELIVLDSIASTNT